MMKNKGKYGVKMPKKTPSRKISFSDCEKTPGKPKQIFSASFRESFGLSGSILD